MTELKLKTLKDLDIFYIGFEPLKIKINEPLVKCNELKAEAIKWVNNCECMGRGCAGCVKLMLFFDLGAEDLK